MHRQVRLVTATERCNKNVRAHFFLSNPSIFARYSRFREKALHTVGEVLYIAIGPGASEGQHRQKCMGIPVCSSIFSF